MFKPKQKHRLVLLMCVAVIVLGAVMLANAYERPMNALMDYVPQNAGIYDTYYCNFKESDCRACHGTTTAWRHHATDWAVTGQCTICHDPAYNPYTNPERDCKECHVDGTWVNVNGGNLGFPHHRTGLAGAGICTACHDSTLVSDANSIEPPQFDPTTITPTPVSCENCHWPSNFAASGPPVLGDWNLWASFPKPTTWPDSLAHPQQIMPNGPVTTGSVVAGDPPPTAGKAFRPLTGTHHEVDGGVATDCVLCHGTAPGGGYQLDPLYPYAIRACENCHDIYTLHDGLVYEHTTGAGGEGLFGQYTINGTLNNYVTQNQKCVACHGDVVTDPMPTMPVTAPIIAGVEPPMASAGVQVTIYDQAGGADFGDRTEGDRVVMQQGISGLIEMDVIAWQPDKIVIEVPGSIFTTNAWINLGVQKKYWAEINAAPGGNNNSICDPGESCQQNTQTSSLAPAFYLRQHPILTFLAPDAGNWGTIVTINGTAGSFYAMREAVYDKAGGSCDPGEQCYAFSTYVELVASNDRYRAIEMSGDGWSALAAWAATSIQINLRDMPVAPTHPLAAYGTLLDVNTDYYVPQADLYKGNWQLYVITDYSKVNGLGAPANPYMLKHTSGHLTGKINTTDYTLQYREVSDPLPFFATDQPFISTVQPSSVKANSLGAVYGINFGTTQDTSYIKVKACGAATPNATLQVVQWSNTRIVYRAPASPPIPVGGANACVQVTVPKATPSVSNQSDPIRFYP